MNRRGFTASQLIVDEQKYRPLSSKTKFRGLRIVKWAKISEELRRDEKRFTSN